MALNTRHEERLAAEIDRDLGSPDAWEKLGPAAHTRNPLATQVSLRLDPEDARRLRRIAHAKRLGYTSLVRQWVQERLRAEEMVLSTFTYAVGHTASSPSNVQVTSSDFTIRELADRVA